MTLYLTHLPTPKTWKFWMWGRRYYYLHKPFTYYSERYGRHKTAPVGKYDGATGALDVCPRCWLVHDSICDDPYWDDGKRITRDQAAQVLSDLLQENGHTIRAVTWKWSTYLFGCTKARGI